MSTVLHKTATPAIYLSSVHTPNFPTSEWFINPDTSAVDAVPTKYWKRPLSDPVLEMNQSEKDAVDASIAAAELASDRSEAADRASLDIGTRSVFEGWLFEVNKLNSRVQELQDAFTAMKGTSTLAALRNAIPNPSATTNPSPSEWLRVSPKIRSQVLQKYVDDINAGTADPEG
jgi:hypothetical protein